MSALDQESSVFNAIKNATHREMSGVFLSLTEDQM
jgi:hypothetical protein